MQPAGNIPASTSLTQSVAPKPTRHADANVRAARQEDIEAIAAILSESFADLFRSIFGPLSQDTVTGLLTALWRADHFTLDSIRVCEIEGRVTGVAILHLGTPLVRGRLASYFALLRRQCGLGIAPRLFLGGAISNWTMERRVPCADDLIYIEMLAVASPHRSQGIGSRLLADIVECARERNRSRLALHVQQTNMGARRLYERWGFRYALDPPPRRPIFGSLLMFCSLTESAEMPSPPTNTTGAKEERGETRS